MTIFRSTAIQDLVTEFQLLLVSFQRRGGSNDSAVAPSYQAYQYCNSPRFESGRYPDYDQLGQFLGTRSLDYDQLGQFLGTVCCYLDGTMPWSGLLEEWPRYKKYVKSYIIDRQKK